MIVVIDLIVILLLVLLNGFFAMAEIALVSSRRARLTRFVEEGQRGARAALALTQDPGAFSPSFRSASP